MKKELAFIKILVYNVCGKAPRERNLTNQTIMSYKSLVKAAYFFLSLECKYMNEKNNEQNHFTDEEYKELDECSRAWGWLEAYINWVL